MSLKCCCRCSVIFDNWDSLSRSEGQQLTEDQVDDCGGGDDDDGEVAFVLTEEWRDFFAKSEAKRKLGKYS